MTDYHNYQFSKGELIWEICRAAFLTGITGWLFFGSFLGSLFLLPAGGILIKNRRVKKGEERLKMLRDDFKDFILSFSSSLQAGYTIEQAIETGREDLALIYPGQERVLPKELSWMEHQMKLKVSCETLFEDFARRSGLEEVRSFSVILTIGKRQGGNLVQITRQAAEQISRKIQVQKEVEQTVAGRVMEKNIMFCMPYFMLLYLRVTNRAYVEILFTSLWGRLIMAVSLAVLWAAGKWADKMIGIQV